jgi:hypothetical protein
MNAVPLHTRRRFFIGELSVNTYVRGVFFIPSSEVIMPVLSRPNRD